MSVRDNALKQIRKKYEALKSVLDERGRRRWAAAEAEQYGRGGLAWVCEATGMSHNTVKKGAIEIDAGENKKEGGVENKRIRREGGGRKKLTDKNANLVNDLKRLVEPATRGDPMSPLRWTNKSTYTLSRELRNQGYTISAESVGTLLKEQGYRLQTNRKTKEGKQHPDRNAQFEYINELSLRFMRQRQPVISVDTKKKELVGNYANKGKEWGPKGEPLEVEVHDFMDKELGKAIPYGVYDVKENEGWVSVGIDHDTAEFAAEAIWRWWRKVGSERYPKARKILIMADGGGSNGSRSRLWKAAIQKLSDRLDFPVHVCHFPPGTSKWNKIEHKMFSYITQNWRGRPLISHEVIINLIMHTVTKTGLKIKAGLDKGKYAIGQKITDDEFMKIKLKAAKFHGDWNYSISPTFD
jgi:transposase